MTVLSRKVRHDEKNRKLFRQRLSLAAAVAVLALLALTGLYGDRFTACVTGVATTITLLAINPWRIRQYAPGLNSASFAIRAFATLAYLSVVIAILSTAALKHHT
jgi:hypothetical protein